MTSTFHVPTQIISGPGSFDEIPGECARRGVKKLLLVTDPGMNGTGLPEVAAGKLLDAGLEVAVFDAVQSDPSIANARDVAARIVEYGAQAVMGFGGGSPIDAAKSGALLATHKGELKDYAGVGKVPGPMLPVIAVPTTAGTGSEVTIFAVMSDPDNDQKFTISSPFIAPTLAVLEPKFTVGLPPALTAATGMDALTHAVEAVGSNIAQSSTDALATKAAGMIFDALPKAVWNGTCLKARGTMIEAACIAGMAFNNTYLGLCHAIASPLGGIFHVPHGLANAVMLRYVMEYNAPSAFPQYAAMAVSCGLAAPGDHPRDAARKLIEAVERLCRDINVPARLRDVGATEDKLHLVAEDALKSVQLRFSPRPATVQQIHELLKLAF